MSGARETAGATQGNNNSGTDLLTTHADEKPASHRTAARTSKVVGGCAAIPGDIQNKYLYAWLLARRQQYTLECCRFERFDAFPVLVELVAQVEGLGNRRRAREYGEKIHRRGRTLRYLSEHGVDVSGRPRLRRFPTEQELRDMIQQAEDTLQARRALFDDALSVSTSASASLASGSQSQSRPRARKKGGR